MLALSFQGSAADEGQGQSPPDTTSVPKRTVEERGSREVRMTCNTEVIKRPVPQFPHLWNENSELVGLSHQCH